MWNIETSIHAIVVLGGVFLTGILPVVLMFGIIKVLGV
jgi:hypothetical protein